MVLSLEQCTDEHQWDAFVRQSPQGSVFCLSPFLHAQKEDVRLYFVIADGKPLLGAILFMKDGEPLPAPRPYTQYQGVMFAPEIESVHAHTRVSKQMKLLDFLLAELEQRHARFSFSLHYGFPDLRSFSWFHYHEQEKGMFRIDLRYTGIVDLGSFHSREELLSQIRSTRRQEARKALARGWTVEGSTDVALLDRLHQLTFERQGASRTPGSEMLVPDITRAALEEGFGELLLCRKSTGEVASAALFLFDASSAYYLFGATDPQYRDENCGSLLLVGAIVRSRERGLKFFDVVGINSPARGDFKTSFNAVPKPYFVVSWDGRKK